MRWDLQALFPLDPFQRHVKIGDWTFSENYIFYYITIGHHMLICMKEYNYCVKIPKGDNSGALHLMFNSIWSGGILFVSLQCISSCTWKINLKWFWVFLWFLLSSLKERPLNDKRKTFKWWNYSYDHAHTSPHGLIFS